MKKLRLLLFKDCERDCIGCCNKDWDLDNLEKEKTFKGYSEILLTGGEPMLDPKLVIDTVSMIEKKTSAKIYMYTAKADEIFSTTDVLKCIDGITLTLHEQRDIRDFIVLNKFLINHIWKYNYRRYKSLRLNIFKGVNFPKDMDLSLWKVKSNIQWKNNCPLPKDEIFRKL